MTDLSQQADELDALRGAAPVATADVVPKSLADHADELDEIRADTGKKTEVPRETPKGDLSWHERLIQGVKDPFNAAAQLLLHTAKFTWSGGGTAPNPVSNAIGDVSESVDSSIKNKEKEYQAARGTKDIDWARGAGNILNPINWIAPETVPAKLAAKVAVNAARGGVGAALSTPVTDGGSFASEKAKQTATGAVGGAALTPIAGALSRVVSPQTSEHVKTLMKAGITPPPGQILGGTAARLEDAGTSIPILGDFIKSAQGRALSDFNTATYQRALDPIGERTSKIVGREGVEDVANKLGAKYNALLPKVTFSPDAQFGQDLAGLKQMVAQLPDAQEKQFNKIMTAQLGKATPAGLMDGETLKGVTSEILGKSKGYSSDPSFDNRQLGDALQELHSAINRNLQRSNPQYASELHAIDTGWANYARIRSAAASQGAHDGIFTPAQLSAAVKAGDKSVGKGNFAKGNALMQDLSDAGKSVLSQKVPDSGTPLRTLVGLGAGGGIGYLANSHPLAAAGTAGGVTLGSLAYTQAGQHALAALLTKRPDLAPAVAQAIRKSLPGAASASGTLLSNIGQQ